MRLAGPDHLAAHLGVERADGAGARQQVIAHVHCEIRIGTDERERARARLFQQRAVMLRRLLAVVDEAGTSDSVGVAHIVRSAGQRREERRVALLWADTMNTPPAALSDNAECQIA